MEIDFWDTLLDVFRQMGSPMRPHASETEIMERIVRDHIGDGSRQGVVRVLILGVTPEIVGIAWPDVVEVTAIDTSRSMIREFWPGDVEGKRRLVRADWRDAGFDRDTFDFVIGDGVFGLLPYPEGYRELAGILSGILVPEGLLIVRVFTQMEPREDPDDIVQRYLAGEITDYHQLRFRLLTALQQSVREGVMKSTATLDQALVDRGVSLEELYERTGYRPLRTGRPSSPTGGRELSLVTYPTRRELEEVISGYFSIAGTANGDHPLAHRCPVFSLRPVK